MPMVFEQIEKIKQQYTDKYVVVDGQRPELARFANLVGQVRTVNMSGRALVEFLDYALNIGWYDIDVDYLKVVDNPPEKEKAPAKSASAKKGPAAKKAPAAKATGGEGKKLSPLELARMQGAAKKDGEAVAASATAKSKAAPTAKLSVAETLEAARTEKGASVADKMEAARTEKQSAAKAPVAAPSASGDKVDRSKMSVADMLAAARGETSGASAPAPTALVEEEPAAEETVAEESSATEEPVVEESVAEAPSEPASEGGSSGGPVDKSSMSVDDMVVWCREHDAS